MEPLEIDIPLKVDNTPLINVKIEDTPIELKINGDDKPIKLKVDTQEVISLSVDKESPIKLDVSEGGSSGGYPVYTGPMEITPRPFEDISLNTSQKVVMDTIVVNEIPYYETSNEKGKTFIIGG